MKPHLRWGPDVVVPLLLLLVVLFAPPPLMRVVAAALLAIRALALGYILVVRAGVTASRGEPLVHANRFAPFTCTLTVRNRTPLPIHFLTVADRIGSFAARQPAQFVVGLGPWEERSFSYELEGRERGEFQLGPVDLVGTDAFGFFPWRAQLPCHQRVIVYPNIFALDLRHKRGLPSGSLKVLNKLYEDVTRYRSLREYQPGDEPKRINWKASARMGALFSMEYVPSIYFPVLVLLNLTAEDYPLAQRAHLWSAPSRRPLRWCSTSSGSARRWVWSPPAASDPPPAPTAPERECRGMPAVCLPAPIPWSRCAPATPTPPTCWSSSRASTRWPGSTPPTSWRWCSAAA